MLRSHLRTLAARPSTAARAASTPRYTTFTGLADGSQLRTATLDSIEYIIVPVVALVGNTVIWAMNAEGPEFVPADELSRTPQQWNGRPVVPDHPNGGTASANDPTVLESQRFGMLFNSRFEKGKLVCEAWLDPSKAERVGGNALSVIESCRAGKMVEVSIGAYISVEPRQGTYNGKKYVGVWHDIISDHLAMGLNGSEGACSNEMGCGAPRIAAKSVINPPEAKSMKTISKLKTGTKLAASTASTAAGTGANGGPRPLTSLSLFDRFREFMGIRSAAGDTSGASDLDIREALWQALYSIEPAFWFLEDYWSETSTVVYTCNPDDEILYYRRTFTVSDSGEVALNDDREQVEVVKDYKPVAASGGCSCGTAPEAKSNPPITKEVAATMDKKAIAKKIIGLKGSPFGDADAATLETLPDAALTLLEKKYEESAATPGTATTPGAPTLPAAPVTPVAPTTPTPTAPTAPSTPASASAATATATPMTEAEWLAQAPGTLRDAMQRAMAQEKARHAALVGGLKDRVNGAYTEQQLAAMGAGELEALAQVVGLGQGQGQQTPTGEYFPSILPTSPDARAAGKVPTPPKPYTLAIAALQGKSAPTTATDTIVTRPN